MALWHRTRHPCVWFTADDMPRLLTNAETDFWRPKFEGWRSELAAKKRLRITTKTIDFHKGSNTEALKAALCFVVEEDDHYGRLIASFLEGVVAYYRDHGPTWREKMCGVDQGAWVGNQWGGLTNGHIADPMMWFSCAHLYDLIYGKGFLGPEEARDFEEMMGLFHQLCCLHEETAKLDNNRAAWLNGGSYLSTLFDEDEIRAELCRERARRNMEKLLSTILDDGMQCEIGGYAQGTIAALHMGARCMRNVEGVDFFAKKFPNAGFEDAYRAWVGLLIPGSSLRVPMMKDRINHWDSTCGGYLEYRLPELGWAISRMGELPWVPMFRHWPQGAEFYTYRVPDNARAPEFLDSHFPVAGVAVLRSSWEADARSIYFRYGLQGSSHGGGLDKLNIELTCNDEPLLTDGLASEYSHHKNVVLVDYQNQEQCSGKLLRADLDRSKRVQFISALGGFGEIPDNPVCHDPRTEFGYWVTKHEECFPGLARVRRTIVLVDRRYFVIRDTLRSLDDGEHGYQWLFHTFADVHDLGKRIGSRTVTYYPRKRFHVEKVIPESRLTDRYELARPGRLSLGSPKARLDMFFLPVGAPAPEAADLARGIGRNKYCGSPEKGDRLAEAPMATIQIELVGRDIAMTTVLDARAAGCEAYVVSAQSLAEEGTDRQVLRIQHARGADTLVFNEGDKIFRYGSSDYRGIGLAEE